MRSEQAQGYWPEAVTYRQPPGAQIRVVGSHSRTPKTKGGDCRAIQACYLGPQPAPGASSEGNVGPYAATMSNIEPGATTGSATKARTNKGVASEPSIQSGNEAGNGGGK